MSEITSTKSVDSTKSRIPRIKRDSRVRIVNPEIFVRCGYEISVQTEIPKMEEKHSELLNTLVAQTQLSKQGRERLVHQLAYESMRRQMKSGAARKIFTKRDERFLNFDFVVHNIRCVKTGTYWPASGGRRGWYEEDDYEPACLSDEKTHRILGGYWRLPKETNIINDAGLTGFNDCEIEDIHCRPLDPETLYESMYH